MNTRIKPVPHREDFTVLVATGSIDSISLRHALNEATQRMLVIDLSQAAELADDCVPVLTATARKARGEGRGFAVVASALPVLRSVWATEAVLPTYLSLSDAMREVAEMAASGQATVPPAQVA